MEKGNDKVCDKHSENLYYTHKKVLPYLKQAILQKQLHNNQYLAQLIVILLGYLHLCFKNFPYFQKTKKTAQKLFA